MIIFVGRAIECEWVSGNLYTDQLYELFLVLFIYALDCHNKKKTEDENQAQALSAAAY